MTASLGPRMNSRTGMVGPRMRFCMNFSFAKRAIPHPTEIMRKVLQREASSLDFRRVVRSEIEARLAARLCSMVFYGFGDVKRNGLGVSLAHDMSGGVSR